MKKLSLIAVIAGLVSLAATVPASAREHGHDRGRHHDDFDISFVLGNLFDSPREHRYCAPPVVYTQPQQVYYYDPRTGAYYAQPVYYSPPVAYYSPRY